jgi:hypothetical protein
MLEKHALLFVLATGLLAETKWTVAVTEGDGADGEDIRARIAVLGNHAIHELKKACILSDMDAVMPEIDRVSNSLGHLISIPDYKLSTVGQAVRHLISRIQDELSSQWYFHLDQRDVPFYVNNHPFGPLVSGKFSSATEDIAEAGKCLALQRPTACVFHLMRVMERGVQALGKKLKVTINVQTETWHQIMLHVDKAVLQMVSQTAAQKKRKSQYAVAASHLGSVRLAWRNEVMHPKQTYTRQEAFDIFNATKVFMAYLAELV